MLPDTWPVILLCGCSVTAIWARYLENLAPRAGFEPATNRLTAGCSTTELPGNSALVRTGVAIAILFGFAKREFEFFKRFFCGVFSQSPPDAIISGRNAGK